MDSKLESYDFKREAISSTSAGQLPVHLDKDQLSYLNVLR